jgi:hypothetical protein
MVPRETRTQLRARQDAAAKRVSDALERYSPSISVGVSDLDDQLPRQLQLMALDFERELVESDVDPDFKRYARARLRDPELLEMYAGGHSEKPMSADDQLADYEDLLDELRGRLKRRLALLEKRESR